ncbi:MAG: MerR family transcriptional regulator [Chitinivibrionales bacterium]|nr:MerR family transcriptional regulator [Chitinivibrionales bacterium]MBD3395942.1 MerR family transcriptional regulator [Chitinivibrionales bacterium]
MNNRKTYYSIREVCAQTALEPHVLRYWESEFPQLRPKKNRAGNRAYRDKDIETIRHIKKLLYEEQYTIPGAKKKLAEVRLHKDAPSPTDHKAVLTEAVEQLRDIRSLLVS